MLNIFLWKNTELKVAKHSVQKINVSKFRYLNAVIAFLHDVCINTLKTIYFPDHQKHNHHSNFAGNLSLSIMCHSNHGTVQPEMFESSQISRFEI